ncbi:hypothetical protein Q427_17320 [Halomonas sp. BC04]|nr:hypothetical protein Q427_17320 [Halomonas sp. BC04]
MESLGHGQGYRYAHSEPQGYPAGSAHDCWPDELPRQPLYQPSDHGQEKRYAQLMAWRAELDAQADGGADA